MNSDTVIVRSLGLQPYELCWQAMQQFTALRNKETLDELWLVEHLPIFTQGQSGKPEHIINLQHIPLAQSDRGGQITYHGPGQLVAYTLIDLKRKQFTIRQLVTALEQAVIELLAAYSIQALARRDAPGVYVNQQKICSLGLRVRQGCSYHGLALNINMDLTPFSYINPCGYAELRMTQLADHVNPLNMLDIKYQLLDYLKIKLEYTTLIMPDGNVL